ncbi:MAG: hypothetical protein HQM10_08465 [Candidatus Riflebacteria bacterium]|nr:hypothetical protein [Candidatus Riflebacteria bacterium]
MRFYLYILFLFMTCSFCCMAADSNPFDDIEISSSTVKSNFSKKGSVDFLKKEILTQFSAGENEGSDKPYFRQSFGFEYLKRFSNDVSTVSSFNMQGRLVYRKNFIQTPSDMEGQNREDLFFEYHNAYLDLFNALDSFQNENSRKKNLGRFNARIGRFYLPFGLNLQTDTHATLMQLSNDQNFGFERDWYGGFWGKVSPSFNYDLYYMLGSGYEPISHDQRGLIGSRVSLSNRYLFENGIEGGLSILSGERISKHAVMRSPGVSMRAKKDVVETLRYGADFRLTKSVINGTVTYTTELSTGKDEEDDIFTQLYQLDYLKNSRRWGCSLQYRRFEQDINLMTGVMMPENMNYGKADSSLIAEYSRYFRYSPGNDNLHWVKFNVEKHLERVMDKKNTIFSIQYYRYW